MLDEEGRLCYITIQKIFISRGKINRINNYASLINQIITWHKFENTLFPDGIISPMNDWELDWITVD